MYRFQYSLFMVTMMIRKVLAWWVIYLSVFRVQNLSDPRAF
jgi:hypothetical protein